MNRLIAILTLLSLTSLSCLARMFDKVCGSDKIRKTFTQRWLVKDIEAMWYQDIKSFRQKAEPYFLYN